MKEFFNKTFKGIKSHPVIHPVLFAAFPVLFLYSQNISETAFNQTYYPLLVSISGSLVLWILLSLLMKSVFKGALATTVCVILFYSYGRFYDLIENWNKFIPAHYHLLPISLFIWGYCVYFIKIAKWDFKNVTKILNVVAAVLIIINLVNIGWYQVKTANAREENSDHSTMSSPSAVNLNTENLPDIYFIILDEYAHPDTMKEYYNYDNSEFIRWLEDKGFYVASGSRTRTPASPQAMAQVLNMEYLTSGWRWDIDINNYIEINTGKKYSEDYVYTDNLFKILAHNNAANFLKDIGYKYIFIGNVSTFNINLFHSYLQKYADQYLNYYISDNSQYFTDFQEMFLKTSAILPFYYTHIIGTEYTFSLRSQTINAIEYLKHITDPNETKFIFTHFLCPHEPFVFGSRGEFIEPTNWQNYKEKKFYRDQYIFITSEIKDVIESLLKNSRRPPIIIIQSDHGLRPHHPGISIGDSEWQKILNAYYLPGDGKKLLYDNISPVNTFRLIFNHYFGTNYELLED